MMDKKTKNGLKDILFVGIAELVLIIFILFNNDINIIIGQVRINLISICVTLGLLTNARIAIILYSARKSENKQEK